MGENRRIRRFGHLLAILSPVLILLLGATYLLVGDGALWSEWLTIWPAVGWGVLFLVRALMVWLEGYRRLAAATALCAALFVTCTTELSPLWRKVDREKAAKFLELRNLTAPTAGQIPLRVVSWNIAGGAPLQEIEALDPDVCLLQEIGAVEPALRTSPHWNEFRWIPATDPGTLTRLPATVLKTEKVGPWMEPQLVLLDLPNGRKLIVANVRLMLPSIVAAMASFDELHGIGRGHVQRLEQFPRLAALLREAAADHPTAGIVLGGDFNTPGGMQSLEPLQSLLRDVWKDAGIGWGGTMTAEMPISRIDQCWVSQDIEVVQAQVRRARGSDHRLLVVDLIVGPHR